MNRRGQWGAMHERVAQGQPPAPGPVSTPSADPRPNPATATVKHCWVTDQHGRLPGLLLEWRRVGSDYQGRVVRPVDDAELGWIVVEEWLPASCLQRA